MTEQTHEHETITESSAARWAYYCAWVPIAGFFLFVALAFIGVIQIGKGRIGFNRLSKGFIVVVFTSILPIAGLVWWGGLPCEYYIGINNIAKHGRVDSCDNYGRTIQSEYYWFGKSDRIVKYAYYMPKGRSDVDIYKLHGKSTIWQENGRLIVESTHWYKNGQLMERTTYEDKKTTGESTCWYDNGKVRMIENYANGKRHGLTSWFDRNGKIERTMYYVNGISQEQIDAAKQAGVEPAIDVDLGGGVQMRMIFIPPGEFIMGSTDTEIDEVSQEAGDDWYKNEGPQHKVTINHGFYLCETEITQEQWRTITGTVPSYFNGNNKPVERVSWNDIQARLMRLNMQGKGTFRLPSEAEWEYSARAGTTTIFSYGNEYDSLDIYAWYSYDSGGTTNDVSEKKANNWGIHDMHGNVWEWCEDDYHENYQGSPNDGSAWIDAPRGERRLLRGGSWEDAPRYCRSADRAIRYPDNNSHGFGFRLSRTLN